MHDGSGLYQKGKVGGCYLAMDTAGASCAVALVRDGEVLASLQERMGRGQSERLLPMVEQVFSASGLDYRDLSALAVTTGPGGFTGVRIGLSAARGFALALDIPLVGASVLEVLAFSVFKDASLECPLLLVMDAKRADVYAQFFDSRGRALCDARAITPSGLADLAPRFVTALPPSVALAGDGWQQAYDVLLEEGYDITVKGGFCNLLAENLAFYLMQQKRLFIGCPDGKPQPLYLRSPDVSLPRAWGS